MRRLPLWFPASRKSWPLLLRPHPLKRSPHSDTQGRSCAPLPRRVFASVGRDGHRGWLFRRCGSGESRRTGQSSREPACEIEIPKLERSSFFEKLVLKTKHSTRASRGAGAPSCEFSSTSRLVFLRMPVLHSPPTLLAL